MCILRWLDPLAPEPLEVCPLCGVERESGTGGMEREERGKGVGGELRSEGWREGGQGQGQGERSIGIFL